MSVCFNAYYNFSFSLIVFRLHSFVTGLKISFSVFKEILFVDSTDLDLLLVSIGTSQNGGYPKLKYSLALYRGPPKRTPSITTQHDWKILYNSTNIEEKHIKIDIFNTVT